MIKNIIFDVGDVLIEYRWQDMLRDYGVQEQKINIIGNKMFDDPLWAALDDATMTLEEVVAEYRKKYPEYGDIITWFITHGEYMHVGRNNVWERIPMLKNKGYKIYLLSNYSEDLFTKHTKDADFVKYIDGKVVSYEIHIAKPDHRIYNYLLDKYSLKADECIFFDDRQMNVEAAEELGINSVQVVSEAQLINELEKLMR